MGELITMQQEQLRLLTQLMKGMNPQTANIGDKQLEIPVHKLGQPKVKLAMKKARSSARTSVNKVGRQVAPPGPD